MLRWRNFLMMTAAGWGLAAGAGDWPNWRGPNWDGTTAESITLPFPADGPRVLWRTNVGIGFSSIAIADGRAYTMGHTNEQDTVWCFEASTGRRLWQHSYKSRLDPQWYEGGPSATPTVHQDRVFTLSKWGDVFCFDAATGKILWERELGREGVRSNRWGFAGSPYIYGKWLVLNAGTTGMALEQESGRTVWWTGTNVTGYTTPVLCRTGTEEVFLLFAQKHLVALRAQSGRELWRYPFETGYDINNTDPLLWDGRVFITSYSRGCALLDVRAGEPQAVYTNKNLSMHLSPGIRLGDYLYAFNGEATANTDFRCLYLPTGEVKWNRKDPKYGSVICAAGRLVILTDKGELLVAEASPQDLKILARAPLLEGRCWTPPSLAHGRLYARTAKGDLVCVEANPRGGG